MSRSGYTYEYDGAALNLWRGAVESAIKGKRGQRLLRELAAAMDAMPEKVLIADELVDAEGSVCALGAVGKLRGMDMTKVDPHYREQVAQVFDIAPALAAEIAFVNDEEADWIPPFKGETPAQRWERMREWVESNIRKGEA
jgi:hypothetical protein